MSARMRGARIAAGAAALALLLAGCAGIPTSGSVGTQPIDLDDDGGDFITLAESPQDGATPTELLAGFLTAQRAPQGNYSIARQYLTDDFRAVWSPTERVLISDTPLVPEAIDEDSLELDVSVQSIVTATGNYSELERPEAQTLPYEFAKNADGQWRIASAPPGTLLSSTRFDRTFGAYPLYFYDPSGVFLVPDVRWFPNTASRADRVVKELLTGQSPVYANGVLVTAFPPSTRLDGGVTISEGTATVDLAGDIASQDAGTRWRMQQQLVASLTSLSEVSSVRLTVGGFPVDVGSGSQPVTAPLVRSDPLGLTADGFGYLSSGAVERIGGVSDSVESLGALGATLARAGDAAAVRTSQGAWIVPASGSPVQVDSRAGLIDPSIDGQGYLWSAVGTAADSIIAVDSGGTPHPLGSPNLDGEIVALDVSRDGARLLIATQGAGGPGVTIAGIIRDADGVPVALGEPLSLTIGTASLLDASWVDPSTVVALSDTGDVDLYRIGGRHEGYGSVSGAVQVVGGNLADGIRVRDADGMLWRHNTSGGWQTTGIVASFLGTQQ